MAVAVAGKPPTGGGGGEPPGESFPEDGGFNAKEEAIAARLRAEGHTVGHVYNDPKQATADAKVDGAPTEFKSPNRGGTSNTINGAIHSATEQSEHSSLICEEGPGSCAEG